VKIADLDLLGPQLKHFLNETSSPGAKAYRVGRLGNPDIMVAWGSAKDKTGVVTHGLSLADFSGVKVLLLRRRSDQLISLRHTKFEIPGNKEENSALECIYPNWLAKTFGFGRERLKTTGWGRDYILCEANNVLQSYSPELFSDGKIQIIPYNLFSNLVPPRAGHIQNGTEDLRHYRVHLNDRSPLAIAVLSSQIREGFLQAPVSQEAYAWN